jgi:hypothetical protein
MPIEVYLHIDIGRELAKLIEELQNGDCNGLFAATE